MHRNVNVFDGRNKFVILNQVNAAGEVVCQGYMSGRAVAGNMT